MNSVIRLDDLNDDILLQIFDNFKFEELLNAADINNKFRRLIVQHKIIPKYRFNERIVEINGGFYVGDEKIQFENGYNSIDDSGIVRRIDYVKIFSSYLVLKLLRNFGQKISRVFMYDLPEKERQRVSSFIHQ